MESLMLLIPMSVVLVLLIGGVFWWSVRSGQFDDMEGPAHRIIADDDGAAPPAPGDHLVPTLSQRNADDGNALSSFQRDGFRYAGGKSGC